MNFPVYKQWVRKNVICRRIDKDLIIIPMVNGIGNIDSNLITLNDTAQRIWELIDGERTIPKIVLELLNKYDEDYDIIYDSVLSTMKDLVYQGLIE